MDQIDLGALDALICRTACMRHEAHLPFAALVRPQARAEGVTGQTKVLGVGSRHKISESLGKLLL
jgi:hypothetical protein